jgi:ferric-dicitrate binding protein FerR (iron transport regulator)
MVHEPLLSKGRPNMKFVEKSDGSVRDPLAWAADCSAQASSEDEPEARDAYEQLAQEFESAWAEMEGLVGTFEALSQRKRNSQLA